MGQMLVAKTPNPPNVIPDVRLFNVGEKVMDVEIIWKGSANRGSPIVASRACWINALDAMNATTAVVDDNEFCQDEDTPSSLILVKNLTAGLPLQFAVATSNAVGLSQYSAFSQAIFLQRPQPPKQFAAELVNAAGTSITVRLTWVLPSFDEKDPGVYWLHGGWPVSFCVVHYRVKAENTSFSYLQEVTGKEFAEVTLTGTVPGQFFEFTLSTYNSFKYSLPSNKSNMVANIAPSPPTNVRWNIDEQLSVVRMKGELELSWRPAMELGVSALRTTHFKVLHRPSEECKSAKLPVKNSQGAQQSMLIDGLELNCKHSFAVVAVNGAGESTASADAQSVIFLPPSQPHNISVVRIDSSTVSVNWATPSNNGHSTIDTYQVEYSKSKTFDESINTTTHRLQIGGSKTSADILGVTPFPIYIRVFASNGVGESVSSLIVGPLFDTCLKNEYLRTHVPGNGEKKAKKETWECVQCPPGASCEGKFFDQILQKEGYWRTPWNLTEFLPCDRPKSCLGVSAQGMKNFSRNGTKLCAAGYKSSLCAVCDFGFYGLGKRCLVLYILVLHLDTTTCSAVE